MDGVEARGARTGTIGGTELAVDLEHLCLEGLGIVVGIFLDVAEVVGQHLLGVLSIVGVECLEVVVTEQAHVGLQGILRELRLVPDSSIGLDAVLLRHIELEIHAGIAHPLVVEVTVEVLLPGIETVREGHFRVVLERLPLGALLPGAATSAVGTEAIAETAVHAVVSLMTLAREQFVAGYLILEGVPDLVGNHGAYRLAGCRCHPECTNHIVVARTCSHPPFGCGVEQVDFHLIIVELALALTRHYHAKTGDVRGIELLCLLQQVVHVHAVALRKTAAVGVIAEIGIPEHEEVLALL